MTVQSEQTHDLSVLVHVDALGGGRFGQTGHGHDVTGEDDHKAGSCGDLHVFDGDREVLGCAEFGGIIRKAVLRFGDADRAVSEAQLLERFDLLFGCR